MHAVGDPGPIRTGPSEPDTERTEPNRAFAHESRGTMLKWRKPRVKARALKAA